MVMINFDCVWCRVKLASHEIPVARPLKFLHVSKSLRANLGNIPKVSKVPRSGKDVTFETCNAKAFYFTLQSWY
jgi:hypothetical protein